MTKGLIPVDIEGLYPVTATYTPVNCDWMELGYEGYTVVQPYSMEDQRFKDEAEEYGSDAETLYYEACDANHPMMNYYYPLPDYQEFDHTDAEKIDHLNLCLVYLNDEASYVLALTGGGMDLSWDIVEAYIRLGYMPPVHFNLPRMAGTPNDMHRRCIVVACIKSREVVKGWMHNQVEDLHRVLAWLKESNPSEVTRITLEQNR